jgi:hypothetical protein
MGDTSTYSASIGHEAGHLLAESHQRAPLGVHETGAQARTAPVSPRVAMQRREPAIGFNLADAPQRLAQHVVLHGALRLGRQVLQRAAAADAEMRAAGRHALRRRFDHLQKFGLVVAAFAAANVSTNSPGSAARHGTQPCRTSPRPAFVVQVLDASGAGLGQWGALSNMPSGTPRDAFRGRGQRTRWHSACHSPASAGAHHSNDRKMGGRC